MKMPRSPIGRRGGASNDLPMILVAELLVGLSRHVELFGLPFGRDGAQGLFEELTCFEAGRTREAACLHRGLTSRWDDHFDCFGHG